MTLPLIWTSPVTGNRYRCRPHPTNPSLAVLTPYRSEGTPHTVNINRLRLT